MTYSDVVEALSRCVMDEEEALALACCEDLLELCEMAVVESKTAGQIHDVPMPIPFSRHAIRRRLH